MNSGRPVMHPLWTRPKQAGENGFWERPSVVIGAVLAKTRPSVLKRAALAKTRPSVLKRGSS
jgi:hypothetical protein